MGFGILRPYALWALLLLVPALIYSLVSYKRLVHLMGMNKEISSHVNTFLRFRRSFVTRTFCRSLAWICLVLAFAGISWGTNTFPVQKSGDAVSMVFDISFSMQADDAPGGMTRLQSAVNYAEELLEHMEGTSVSAVIAKGEGTVAVPLTEDFLAVNSLLDCLSPYLMTTEGSSLGSGIETAINSFPVQSSQANRIWLFTDGEETDNTLVTSLSNAFKYGIPVTIIGFGSERESEVLAGDGKTSVKTALRSDAVRKAIEMANKKNIRSTQSRTDIEIKYIDASEVGSAYRLLSELNTHKNIGSKNESTSVAYEVQNVPRYNLFIALALVFFIASYLLSEIDLTSLLHKKILGTSLVVLTVFSFTGCSSGIKTGAMILQGKFEWNRKNYPQAVSCFLNAAEYAQENDDPSGKQYALYGLAVTYLMQDETQAALERFNEISSDAPESVRFAVMYNTGIIAHRKGDFDKASECFKNALEIDSSNLNAKINLELSLRQKAIQTHSQEQTLTPLTENSQDQSAEQALYSIIRENDQNKWKNEQQKEKLSSSKDY